MLGGVHRRVVHTSISASTWQREAASAWSAPTQHAPAHLPSTLLSAPPPFRVVPRLRARSAHLMPPSALLPSMLQTPGHPSPHRERWNRSAWCPSPFVRSRRPSCRCQCCCPGACLPSQGEVEQISMMRPKGEDKNDTGLLEYLEDIIGTDKYVQPIEEAAKGCVRVCVCVCLCVHVCVCVCVCVQVLHCIALRAGAGAYATCSVSALARLQCAWVRSTRLSIRPLHGLCLCSAPSRPVRLRLEHRMRASGQEAYFWAGLGCVEKWLPEVPANRGNGVAREVPCVQSSTHGGVHALVHHCMQGARAAIITGALSSMSALHSRLPSMHTNKQTHTCKHAHACTYTHTHLRNGMEAK